MAKNSEKQVFTTEAEERHAEAAKTPVMAKKMAKKGILERTVRAFYGETGPKGFWGHVVSDIVRPMVQDMVYDGITSVFSFIGDSIFTAFATALYGDDSRDLGARRNNLRTYRGRNKRGNTNRVRYNDVAGKYSHYQTTGSGTTDYPDRYTIRDRYDADKVLSNLRRDIEDYGYATLHYYYTQIGAPTDRTDKAVGWSDLTRASIRPKSGEFEIIFPPLEDI